MVRLATRAPAIRATRRAAGAPRRRVLVLVPAVFANGNAWLTSSGAQLTFTTWEGR